MSYAHRERILAAALFAAGFAILAVVWLLSKTGEQSVQPSAGSTGELRGTRDVTELAALPTGVGVRTSTSTSMPDSAAHGLSHGLYDAPAGTALRFSLVNEAMSEMRNEKQKQLQKLTMSLASDVEVDVLERRGDELALALSFPNCRLQQRSGDVDAPAEATWRIAEALALTTYVRLRDDGSTLGFRFAPQMSFEQRNTVRSLWFALRANATDAPGTSWAADETDALGPMRCSYRGDASSDTQVEVVRNGRVYLQGAVQRADLPTIEGSTRFVFERAIGWIARVDVDETTHLVVPDMPWRVDVHQTAHCQLVAHDSKGPRGIDWDAVWEPASGERDSDSQAQASLADSMREQLGDRTIAQLVAQIQALLAADDDASPELVRAREELAWLLKLNKGALAELAKNVLDPRLDPKLRAMLIDCIGRCGSPQAQALLADWIGDSNAQTALRQESVLALTELHEPTDAVVASVAGLLTEGTDADLRDTAMLTMGALANIGGSYSQGQQALSHLLDWKDKAEKNELLPQWIEALGNSGSPAVVDAVRPYLVDENEQVRAAAVHALRLVMTSEATALAAERARVDLSLLVRSRAAGVLVVRVANDARQAVAWMLEHEPFGDLRGQLIVGLGTQASYDALARTLLEGVVASDPLEELRALAQEQLNGVNHG